MIPSSCYIALANIYFATISLMIQNRNVTWIYMYFCGLMALQYVYRVLIDVMIFPLITSSTGNELMRHTFAHKEAYCNYHNLGFSVYLPIDSRVLNARVVTERLATNMILHKIFNTKISNLRNSIFCIVRHKIH